MSLSTTLGEGFSIATRRPSAILLDLAWKLIWLVIVGFLFVGLGTWIYWVLGTTEIQGPVSGALRNPVSLMLLGQQMWAQYAEALFWMALLLVITSFVIWLLLEAWFRSRILTTGRRDFRFFLLSSGLKQILLIIMTVLVAVIAFGQYLKTPIAEWSALGGDYVGPAVIAGLICAALWFVLTIFETVVRAGAVDLLGRELFAVTGLIGTLVLFEGMLVSSAIGLGLILASFVSDSDGAWILLTAAVLATIVLNIVHSFLLVVRYSAVQVLMRTSLVPSGPGIIGHVDEFRDDSHPRFWFPVHSTHRTPHS